MKGLEERSGAYTEQDMLLQPGCVVVDPMEPYVFPLLCRGKENFEYRKILTEEKNCCSEVECQ